MKSYSSGNCLRPLTWVALFMALTGWNAGAAESTGAIPVAARETSISEVLALRPSADRGDVAAQVALGDLFNTRQQYAEAVHWYRFAATNGEVTAQLALAGCLIAGRGTPENRREAAHWMRLAADGVEQAAGATLPTSGPRRAPTQPIVLTRSNAVPSAVKTTAEVTAAGVAAKNLFTIGDSRSTRETREDNLSVVEPRLQERSVGLQPSVTPK